MSIPLETSGEIRGAKSPVQTVSDLKKGSSLLGLIKEDLLNDDTFAYLSISPFSADISAQDLLAVSFNNRLSSREPNLIGDRDKSFPYADTGAIDSSPPSVFLETSFFTLFASLSVASPSAPPEPFPSEPSSSL
jgi:hypothetical protein